MRDSGRIFVLPEFKLAYVSVAKSACTSLKWMIAGLAGEDPAQFRAGTGWQIDDIEAIHQLHQWRRRLTVAMLSDEVRREISPDNGWFIFSVVRDPWSRVFSAWQDKFLLRAPGYLEWRNQPWYPRLSSSSEQIVEDFARFIEMLDEHPRHRLRRYDTHFRTQSDLLYPDAVDYSQIYDLTSMAELTQDLRTHLQAQGWQGQLDLRRSNETPLRANAAAFDDGTRKRIEDMYAEDFARFGQRWSFDRIEGAPDWTGTDIAAARTSAMQVQRIGELRNLAVSRNLALTEARATLAHLERSRVVRASVWTHDRAVPAVRQRLGRVDWIRTARDRVAARRSPKP